MTNTAHHFLRAVSHLFASKWKWAGWLVWLPAAVLLAQEAAGLTIHVVQRGETLFQIAQAYATSIDYLAEVNGITNTSSIQVGQRLLVPVTPAAIVPQTHTIQPGETLATLATLYQVTVIDLQQWNNIANPDQIYPGQILQIQAASAESPVTRPAPLELAANQTLLHTVATGETLYRIAQQYGMSVNTLAVANNLTDPTRIFVGQTLLIPVGAAEPTAQDLPAPITSLALKPLIFSEGETGSIQLTTSAPATVSGTFLGRDLRVIPQNDNTLHSMLIGIPVYTEAGIYPVALTIVSSSGQMTYNFSIRVVAGGYAAQNLTVSAELAPLLAAAPQEYELELLTRVTSLFSEQRVFEGVLGLPAAAPMNSPFGTRRSYNDGAFVGFHTGADFASAPGTPVLAAAPGRVVLADLLNIRGNTVVLDHGWGVFSVYSHQSQLNVRLDDFVVTGQVIGSAGATGRTTGPHLHWEIWVNAVPVNPLQWTRVSFP